MIAAGMVILCHAYPLTGKGKDMLQIISDGKYGWGIVGVSVFFVFSGFFLTGSLEKDNRTVPYLKKRVVRIFPELIFVVVISVFLIGPIFTTWKVSDYFSSPETYKYLLNALLIPVHNLPGVFESAPYNPTINGALWTLPVEFGCYIFLIILVKVKKKIPYKCVNILLVGTLFILYPFLEDLIRNSSVQVLAGAVLPFQMFIIGHLWWEKKDRLKFDIKYFSIALIFLGLNITVDVFRSYILFAILFSYIILSMTSIERPWIKTGVWEKLSYGIYLWGFPVGQIIVELIPEISPLLQFGMTFLTSGMLAFLMYKMKEYFLMIKTKRV